MKALFIVLFFVFSLFADTKKVYFYSEESNINNFKSLKVNFDNYLKNFGDYEFQAFSDKDSFELYLNDEDIVVILSSWHYLKIAKRYNIKAKLVAQKKESCTDTKVLIGKNNTTIRGIVTSAYNDEYTHELLSNLTNSSKLSIIEVPKEIDALMSVGFGMSQFALVSKDSFELLKEINAFLAKDLKIYKESKPIFRIVVASKKLFSKKNKLMKAFSKMDLDEDGKKVLNLLGLDKLKVLTINDLKKMGGVK